MNLSPRYSQTQVVPVAEFEPGYTCPKSTVFVSFTRVARLFCCAKSTAFGVLLVAVGMPSVGVAQDGPPKNLPAAVNISQLAKESEQLSELY